MAEKVFLPLEDDSNDLILRLTSAEGGALHLLLSRLTLDEMVEKGLSREQALLICDVIHVCY